MSAGFGCPHGDGPLGGREVRGVAVEACDKCNSSLVTQTRLTPLLEALSVDLLVTFNPDAELKPLPERPGTTACPSCHKPMERSDYCGAKLVWFDRCNACALLWLASEELGVMSLMWARMEARLARIQAQNRESLSGMDILLDSAHIRRVVNNSIFRISPLRMLF